MDLFLAERYERSESARRTSFSLVMFYINERWFLRILNEQSDKKLDNISVFLTKEEAVQLRGYLNQLLDDPKKQHAHLSSKDYKKEITICLYDEKNSEKFHQRAIKLIKEDA